MRGAEPDTKQDYKDWKREVIGICGPAHTGKSTLARKLCEDKFPGEDVFLVPVKTKGQKGAWLGNYANERCVIFDEFDYKSYDNNELKMLFDRRPQKVTTRSGGVGAQVWDAELIIFSCNTPFEELKKWIKGKNWDGPMYTRITSLTHLTKIYPREGKLTQFISDEEPKKNKYTQSDFIQMKKQKLEKMKLDIILPDSDVDDDFIGPKRQVQSISKN